MINNILEPNNIGEQTDAKNMDPLAISYHLRRRPSYVQSYCILQCVSMSPRMKIYQVARMLGLDYYQAMKRVTELAKKGFMKVTNGSMTITNEGAVLKEILGQVIVLMHADDTERNNS
ncbi:MAG: hypothetical protein QXU32_03610 [Nitrososphaerales archaeon]